MNTLLLLCLMAHPQAANAAQPRVALASTSAATALPEDPSCSDLALLRLEEGAAYARLFLPDGGWNALLGDADGDQQFDLPAGLDALAFAPVLAGAPVSILDFWFSTDSDFQGWKDGDVLRVTLAGTLERVVAEDELRAALGTSSALDVDALERDGHGQLWFSLRDGLAASVLGAVEDGDILVFDPSTGSVQRAATESEVQAWVDQALPGLGPIGDVKSLAFDPQSGDLLFSVQSPSSNDATVFSNGGGGTVFAGFSEANWGFQGAAELDALTFPSAFLVEPPLLTADQSYVSPGQTLTLHVQRATPGAIVYGLAGVRRALELTQRGGFHLAALDPAGPVRAWPGASATMTADAAGQASASVTVPALPPGMSFAEVVIQALDTGGRGLATPWIVRMQ